MLERSKKTGAAPPEVKVLQGKPVYQSPINEDVTLYNLDDFKTDLEQLTDRDWLVVQNDPNGVGMSFAVLHWHTADDDGTYMEPIWIGWGISSSLRELRHSWFGADRDGYMFYAPLKTIQRAAEELLKYFDGD